MSIVLISGGTSGIGLATAEELATKGYTPVLVGRNRERGEAATQKIPAAIYLAGDVAVEGEAERIVRETAKLGKITGLVTAAGAYREKLLIEETDSAIRELFAVNVYGTISLCRACASELEKNGGAVVTVASDAAINGNVGASCYAATKGAVAAFTRSWSLEMAVKDVRVNCVLPGDTDTPLTRAQWRHPNDPTDMAAHYPLGHIATPREVASVIVFLLSGEASFVTGACWTVDGGLTAW